LHEAWLCFGRLNECYLKLPLSSGQQHHLVLMWTMWMDIDCSVHMSKVKRRDHIRLALFAENHTSCTGADALQQLLHGFFPHKPR
jgi:hypothetical protein